METKKQDSNYTRAYPLPPYLPVGSHLDQRVSPQSLPGWVRIYWLLSSPLPLSVTSCSFCFLVILVITSNALCRTPRKVFQGVPATCFSWSLQLVLGVPAACAGSSWVVYCFSQRWYIIEITAFALLAKEAINVDRIL